MLERLTHWLMRLNGMTWVMGHKNRMFHSVNGSLTINEMFWPELSGKTTFIKLIASGTSQLMVGDIHSPSPIKVLVLTPNDSHCQYLTQELEDEILLGRVDVEVFDPQHIRLNTLKVIEYDYILLDEVESMNRTYGCGHPLSFVASRFDGARKPVPTKLIGMY